MTLSVMCFLLVSCRLFLSVIKKKDTHFDHLIYYRRDYTQIGDASLLLVSCAVTEAVHTMPLVPVAMESTGVSAGVPVSAG